MECFIFFESSKKREFVRSEIFNTYKIYYKIGWEVRYQKYAAGVLGEKPDDLDCVATYMNDTFAKPVSGDRARFNSRTTIVTPPVVHTLSEYKSLTGVREHYCYYIQPNCEYVY